MPHLIAKLVKFSVVSASVLSMLSVARPAKADAIFKVAAADGGSTSVDLSSIIDGSWVVDVSGGAPSSGSIDVINDIGSINSFTVYYYGTTGTDAGSTIRCQNFSFAAGSTTCSVYDPIDGLTYANGAKTPANLTLASYAITFDFASAMSGNFDFQWASLSGVGDTGCIAGTPTCSVVTTTPEPGGLLLLGTALIGMAALASRVGHS